MADAMRFCKDCRHVQDGFVVAEYCVRSVKVIDISLITGQEIRGGWEHTFLERESGWLVARMWGECGKEGRFWEPRD